MVSRVQHTRLHCVTFRKVELLKSEKGLKENITSLDLLTNEFIICTVRKQIETLLPRWNIVCVTVFTSCFMNTHLFV